MRISEVYQASKLEQPVIFLWQQKKRLLIIQSTCSADILLLREFKPFRKEKKPILHLRFDSQKIIALNGENPDKIGVFHDNIFYCLLMAEKEGFEPSRRLPDLLP